MDLLNDEQLNEILHEWRAPAAPAHLEAKIFAAPTPWWRWLLTGSIRIPVPALLLAVLLLVAVLIASRKPQPPPVSQGLAEFQPVKQLNIRVIRSNYEPH